jgi:hypothetical protein
MPRDPIATGIAALETIAFHGTAISPAAMAMDLQALHTDGANFYQYLRGNPFMGSDPLGLSSDPFDMVDDYVASSAGERTAFLSAVGQGAKATAVLAATIASYIPLPGVGIAGDLALVALGEQSGSEAALSLAIGAVPGGKLMALLSKIGHGAMDLSLKYARHMGAKVLNKLSGGASSLFQRARGFLARGCGCFTGPTQIWTDRGLLPIADVQVGDLVLAHDDETGDLSFREVLKTYVRQGAPIVLVTLMAIDPAMGNTLTTIETTEEHPFLVEATANGDPTGWTRVDELSPGDTIKQFDGLSPGSVVVSVQFTSRREQVHNLEVEGLHTFLVGADGVVVHNGGPCPYSPDIAALVNLAQELYKRSRSAPVSIADAATIKQWAQELGLRVRVEKGVFDRRYAGAVERWHMHIEFPGLHNLHIWVPGPF